MVIVGRKAFIFMALAGLSIGVTAVDAQTVGRVSGHVLDTAGHPIHGVVVKVTSPDLEKFDVEKETNAKGRFLVTHTNVTSTYLYTLNKTGFETLIDHIKPTIGTKNCKFVMRPSSTSGEGAGSKTAENSRAIPVYNKGATALMAGDVELARDSFLRASEIDPQLAVSHIGLASLSMLEQNYDAAASSAEKALALDPGNPRALQLRFDAHRLAGNDSMAQESAQALREIGGLSEAAKRVFNEGAQAYNSGDLELGRMKFETAVNMDPSLVVAYVALARLALQQNEPKLALNMAREALQREPENVLAMKLCYEGARRSSDTTAVSDALARISTADPEGAANYL
ncbi:MAG: hypothetical protein GY906_16675, partial [bacterium]|nr:hypothetical protein [bacterium]